MKLFFNKCTGQLICMAGALLIAQSAGAASFDCAKASTKVEHIICDTPEISKLDEELNAAYKNALQDEKQAATIRQAQKQWMKERNACGEVDCLVKAYRERIGELNATKIQTKSPSSIAVASYEEHYALVMSRNDEMCNHMLRLMNDDLKRLGQSAYGRTFDRHDAFVESLQEFNSIPWKTGRVSYEISGKTHYWNVESALFDLNNDGVLDYVIRNKGYLSGMRTDSIYMLNSNVADHASTLSTKELFDSNNQISLSQISYKLAIPIEGQSVSLWLLSPFVYDGIAFVYMQSLYKKSEAVGGDFVVIAKYGGGNISDTTEKMEDTCYIKRDGVKR